MKIKPNKSNTYKSQGDLARAVGCSAPTLSNLKKRGDWPVGRIGPWSVADVEAVKVWREGHQENRAAQNPEMANAAHQLKVEQVIITRVKRELLQGKYIENEIHERAVVGVATRFTGELDALAARLPALLTTTDPGEVEAILTREFDASRQRISDQAEIELSVAEQAAKKKRRVLGRTKGAKRK